jgi:hypothetical protein
MDIRFVIRNIEEQIVTYDIQRQVTRMGIHTYISRFILEGVADIHTYHSHFIPEDRADASQIFSCGAHVFFFLGRFWVADTSQILP